ncbi:hypothetical protein [Oharaeibacter diazotrophicus]|uniref:Uncharacterized protein n=1 Tax=Oharaeibacter diazotrophicus TaxID=1920512 RepID=A0A4R6RBA1_9HYPH|nr:hypothetical protein [Oharaeibacter diazotrophicus]TDP83319.1 hypothetical protein EDD54_3281 [Oharaeibacter diazotrophicus]BBE72152.1 hypothetical protein OHA_1_01741 [Pleomorphomonas sp. SM30]GLS78918.1 hypothetical protein GCM10007904_42550 [Oharaeibacter diazotrophicus]
MQSEFGDRGERQEQQQQGVRSDLERQYQAIGISAVSAAASMTRAPKKAPRPVSTDMPQYED